MAVRTGAWAAPRDHDMLATEQGRIGKLFAEGKSEQEVIALHPLADLDKKWANNPQHALGNLRSVYRSFERV